MPISRKCPPSCGKNDHTAGTSACPIFASKQRVIKYAYENNISVSEAGKILAGYTVSPSAINTPVLEKPDTDLRKEIDKINQKLQQLAASHAVVDKETEKRLQAVENDVSEIKSQLTPLLSLEPKMKAGFTSLDNRLTMLQDMWEKDREERVARQKARDLKNAIKENLPNLIHTPPGNTVHERNNSTPKIHTRSKDSRLNKTKQSSSHLNLFNGTREVYTSQNLMFLKSILENIIPILYLLVKHIGKTNIKLNFLHTTHSF